MKSEPEGKKSKKITKTETVPLKFYCSQTVKMYYKTLLEPQTAREFNIYETMFCIFPVHPGGKGR